MKKWPFFNSKPSLEDLKELYNNLSTEDQEEFKKSLIGDKENRVEKIKMSVKDTFNHIFNRDVKPGEGNKSYKSTEEIISSFMNLFNNNRDKIKEDEDVWKKIRMEGEDKLISMLTHSLISLLSKTTKQGDTLVSEFSTKNGCRYINIISYSYGKQYQNKETEEQIENKKEENNEEK